MPVEKAFALGIVNSLEKGVETAEKLSVSATSADPAILLTSSSGVTLLLVLSSVDARSVGTLLAKREFTWDDADVLAGTKALQHGAAKASSNPKKFNFIFWYILAVVGCVVALLPTSTTRKSGEVGRLCSIYLFLK